MTATKAKASKRVRVLDISACRAKADLFHVQSANVGLISWSVHGLGPGYPKNILKSVTRVCIIALPPKMARSGAAAAAKPARKGAMLDAHKLSARTKAQKRKTPPPSDDDELELEEDAEEETSDSDTGGTLAQKIDDKERRAEKLQKLQREKKAEEELDKKLAEQEAKNAKN